MKILSNSIQYARHVYTVELEPSDEGKTDMQLIVEADRGNGCFGGAVYRKSNNIAEVHVYTD